MRRLANAALAVATTAAVMTLSTGTALAHGPEHAKGQSHSKTSHAKVEHKTKAHKEHKHHRKVKVLVTMTGVVTDTATAVVAVTPTPSDTPTAFVSDSPTSAATGTVTIAVKGGERSLHRTLVVLTFDQNTVVRRGDRPATVADLRPGDHVSVRARRMPDGSWLALRVNAAPRETDDD